MAKRRWIRLPEKKPKPQVSISEKQLIEQQCNDLIVTELKPKFILSRPEDYEWNYLVDIFGKWYRNYFYFCSIYNYPGENAISPSFESRFVRLEYTGKDCFNVAYMRHTGQWWQIMQDLSLEECLSEIRNNPLLQPIS
ncbi:hypothetical protein GS682_02410 [Nostoc sp. B(2019)]|nr:hypothetical protein [Nostoc sp. B(2019)]